MLHNALHICGDSVGFMEGFAMAWRSTEDQLRRQIRKIRHEQGEMARVIHALRTANTNLIEELDSTPFQIGIATGVGFLLGWAITMVMAVASGR